MKRFLQDAILVFLLVYAGSYIQNQDTKVKEVEHEVNEFENKIAQHKVIENNHSNNIIMNENKASKMAKNSSECIINCIEKGVVFISSIYDAFIQ